jgi:hypothetical protein
MTTSYHSIRAGLVQPAGRDGATGLSRAKPVEDGQRATGLAARGALVFYWAVFLDGVLRKWVLPEYQKLLFFLPLPVVAYLYYKMLRNGRWPRHAILQFTILLAVCALFIAPLQMVLGGYSGKYALIAAYGWLSYFFYVPLSFVLGAELTRSELSLFMRHTLWMGVLSAPLVLLQFFSTPRSVINAGVALQQSDQFRQLGSALGHIRPASTFSSSLGLWMFLGALTVAVVSGWIDRGRKRKLSPLLVLGTGSLFTMLAVSGSRGALLQCALVLAGTLLAGFLSGHRRIALRASLIIFFVTGTSAILWPILFPSGFETFMTRWNEAATVNTFTFGIFGRAFYALYGWIHYLNTPLLGYLLGIGTDAAARLPWVHMPQAAYHWTGFGIWARESGLAVHLVDLGLLAGSGYIIFRIWFTLWLARRCWIAASRYGDILPAVLFSFAGELILMGQVTVQGDVGNFTWIFLGLTLAAAKLSKVRPDAK